MATEKRLYDLDEAFKDLEKRIWWTDSEKAAIRSFLFNQKRVDAVEVVHGRWVKKRLLVGGHAEVWGYDCSICGKTVKDWKSNYCPNCGAKMDGEKFVTSCD